MITDDKINSFQERADALRHELTDAIVNILKENNLTEIKLSKQPDKVPWVVWFDRRNYGYDSRVTKVSLNGYGFAVEIYDEDCCTSETLTSDEEDLACTNIDWLWKILLSIRYTLSLPKSISVATIAGQLIEWSYDEPGISELSESEIDEIETALTKGIQKGELCYYDEYDVEFNGVWNIKMNEPNG